MSQLWKLWSTSWGYSFFSCADQSELFITSLGDLLFVEKHSFSQEPVIELVNCRHPDFIIQYLSTGGDLQYNKFISTQPRIIITVIRLSITYKHMWDWHSSYLHFIWSSKPGPFLSIKMVCPCLGIPIIIIRESWDCLLFIVGIPILITQYLYIEMAPSSATFLNIACFLEYL